MSTAIVARHSSLSASDDRALVSVFAAYTVAATLWLLFATAVGVLLAYKFGAPDFGRGAWLTFGRLRPIHTNATFYGWASLALVGTAYYVVARSSGTRLYSARLAWIGLVLFNVAAVAGTIALDLGYSDGDLEYREWPWPIRLIFLAALVVTAWNLLATVARRSTEDIYLSNWYILGGVLWTCIIAIVAILPWYQYGLGQVSVSGFYMHNAVGMWFTPLALGIFYYALPKVLSRPIYSYALGVFAFWTNLVFYPIIGAHHFLFSPLPWWLQTLAIVFSVAMLVPVWGGSANFLLTMRGHLRELAHSYPLMFIFVGVVGYLVGSTQGTLRGVSLAAGGVAPHQLHGRTFASDHVRLRDLRHLGRHLCVAAAGQRQGAEPVGSGSALLDGAGRQFHLCHFALDRRHGAGPGLDPRSAVHPVGDRHAAVLRLARYRRLADVPQPHRVRLERLAHDVRSRRR